MLKTSEIFQSSMMLQRGKPVFVWGEADAGAEVTVCIQGRRTTVSAGRDGRWTAMLPPLRASGEEILQIGSGEEKIVLRDVAVGEVWIAGGQSNMEFHMRYEKHLGEVKPVCCNPRIRFFDVPETAYAGQRQQFDYTEMARWRKASPEEIEYFSAVGYYFARDLEKALDVPVGIVGCNWGGTHCASWMNPETVRTAGPDWMTEYDAFAGGTDLSAYFDRQKHNPLNGRGTPFSDPFGEFIMPATHTQEELSAFFAAFGADAPERGGDPMVQSLPGSLYENMVKTLPPFSVRGVLWYQGESDDVFGKQAYYEAMLAGMIGDWRALWKEDLPFLIVQLPGFERWLDIVCADYETIREAQRKVSESVPQTWLCSVSDAGERYDIHPKDKQVVGKRLALLAEEHVYAMPVIGDAPVAVSVHREGRRLEILFRNAGTGLVCTGDTVAALRLSADGDELPFRAEINGSVLTLTPERELHGTATIRFASGSWYRVNLYNDAGIPAIPFTFTVEL